MNTYTKYAPNVFLAKCEEQYEKGETIIVETKYGKENESIVFNLIFERDGFYYYSIIRADGFNVQEWAKRRAERNESIASNAAQKSHESWKASNEGSAFLSLGEPIKIGHHSERGHRALIERNHNRMSKSVELSNRAELYASKAEYWERKADTINVSMPESIEYFEYLLESAKAKHEGLKDGSIERNHMYSLTYAKNLVSVVQKKLDMANKLWA
jgi:hypothetical protein